MTELDEALEIIRLALVDAAETWGEEMHDVEWAQRAEVILSRHETKN